MRKATFISFVFALFHAFICLWLIPRTNAASQWWFDTGAVMSKAEGIAHLVALVLSFPIALSCGIGFIFPDCALDAYFTSGSR